MSLATAVEVRDAVKSYVKGTVVLNHMNMTVQKGTIYGLLGSSGCGKTSILSCIVGLRRLDSGKIFVFGKEPGTAESGIPGRKVGYMPQEIALYPNFTISEILHYFGRIYGMEKSSIEERVDFLIRFLQLPKSSLRISTLSGGQQRRTSLATAFVHNPELLILDEPTVGLDPILRNSIWDHLCEVVKNGQTTVIITTHYIQEARKANRIGLMRNGRLLAEDSPEILLEKFNVPLLEQLVLELCKRDHSRLKAGLGATPEGDEESDKQNNNPYPRDTRRVRIGFKPALGFFRRNPPAWNNSVAESDNCDCVVVGYDKTTETCSVTSPSSSSQVTDESESNQLKGSSQWQRIHSLIRRNFIYFIRNLGFILMLLIFPALQTAIVASTIGGDPKNMSLAVVNEELPNWTSNCNSSVYQRRRQPYSCRFLSTLESNSLNLVPFSSRDKAIEETHSGNLYGLLTIPVNYTQHLVDRNLAGLYPFNESMDGSTISVNLDMSNYIASVLIQRKLYGSLETYAMQLANATGGLPKQYEVPLQYRTPVYGRLDSNYTEYVVPGALMMILFLMPMASCGLALVADKRQGTMDRSMAAGVTTFEMMVAFFFTDGLMIIFQTLISTGIIVFGFDFKVEGSYVLYGLMCCLIGLCGQAWGFVLGIICPDEASLLTTGFTIHFPMLIIGGVIWPLEGIFPKAIRYFSHCLPVTAALYSMRSIVARGVGIADVRVWSGFAIVLTWVIVSWAVAVVKYKTYRK